MTSYMTQISIWSDRDRQDEQFLLHDLCQHMHSTKDICQKRQPFLGPLFKGPTPSAWYQKKGLVILYISCSTIVQKFLTVLEISVQVSLWGRTCNSIKGAHRNKMIGAYCSNFILNNFCSIMLCEIFVVFEILVVKYLQFWPLKSLIT